MRRAGLLWAFNDRNDEAQTLAACLRSGIRACHEIVIADTVQLTQPLLAPADFGADG